MCGRYYRRSDKRAIAEYFRTGDSFFNLPPSFNVAPTSTQPVVRLGAETGDRELALMRWGLIPFWATKDAKIAYSTINAKCETIATSPAFREAFKRRRCLVPADGFYEWVRPASRPDDCPAWSHDRTCRPIGSTLRGQAGLVTVR
jgi:putative SOS response-associated peptidase YedK